MLTDLNQVDVDREALGDAHRVQEPAAYSHQDREPRMIKFQFLLAYTRAVRNCVNT